jgi:hypothetical protein
LSRNTSATLVPFFPTLQVNDSPLTRRLQRSGDETKTP